MMNPQILHHKLQTPTVTQALIPWQKPFLSGDRTITSLPAFHKQISAKKTKKSDDIRRRRYAGSIKAVAGTTTGTRVNAILTVKPTAGGILERLGSAWNTALDNAADLFGRSLQLELVAAELDPKSGHEKPTLKAYARTKNTSKEGVEYEADFVVPHDFGQVGAIIVENEHHIEMFLSKIVLDGSEYGPVIFACESWLAPKSKTKDKRIFFSTKSYLPWKTPSGLKRYREKELETVRGDGTGERKKYDRIYDYDVYNDLGDPDSSEDKARPVLGGREHPYPRRCRTGRPMTKKDNSSESRTSDDIYLPRDESFSEVKNLTFSVNTVYSVLHAVTPAIEGAIQDRELGFPYFTEIDSLFNEGIHIPAMTKSITDVIPNLIKSIEDSRNQILLFDTPEFVDRDKFGWLRDVEFSRQILAGLNPMCIQLVKEWPLKSKLDPKVYGPQESAITEEFVAQQIKGLMPFDEALKNKKLFMLDYHDILLPYVEKVRQLQGTTLYGSRALFFLTPDETLMPVAIELTRPKMGDKPQWREAFRPCHTPTGTWLWKIAKAHLLAHDSGIHQLVSHWLRTHCCVEPYIIATHRQLSEMHPIHRLLHPHFRFTMEINALARSKLINADGVIESTFSPLKYSIELSSAAYDQLWRFDHEALPANLISRGMAEPDLTAPHGLKLAIEDYPFANDGLILWEILEQWITNYVTYYYPEAKSVQADAELQAWWTEIRTVGHADKKDEPWWPTLNTPAALIGILTTIIWVTSGHHAAVNFGQYAYAGYFPNRPTMARTTMPKEEPNDEKRWDLFIARPEIELLKCFPTQIQACTVMAVLHVLSTHSPDEEYIGEKIEPAWEEEPNIKAAFEVFNGRLKELEGIIDARNNDKTLRNRHGAGVVPYELLKPFSGHGATGKGVPNSISI